jgi:hypothetical protein
LERHQYEIQREAASRGVRELFHFTPSPNARSILCDGLLSRQVLATRGIPFLATDPMRLDEHLEAVSLSVHSINESMLVAKRREYVGQWLVFVLDASILWTHECRFCWRNAASNEIRHHRGFIGGPWAFRKMFDDRPMSVVDSRSSREALGLLDRQPTDNAAEVQVLESIVPDLIRGVFAPNHRLKLELEALMQSIGRVRPVKVLEELCR